MIDGVHDLGGMHGAEPVEHDARDEANVLSVMARYAAAYAVLPTSSPAHRVATGTRAVRHVACE